MEERIPFDIKYRPDIEAGKYLVVTREGNSVRIVCWEAKLGNPLVCLVTDDDGREDLWLYPISGRYDGKAIIGSADLFLVPNPDYKEPAVEQPSVSAEPSVDWDAFRREAAKDILCAIIPVDWIDMGSKAKICERAIVVADELIKQLKEGKK